MKHIQIRKDKVEALVSLKQMCFESQQEAAAPLYVSGPSLWRGLGYGVSGSSFQSLQRAVRAELIRNLRKHV